MLWTSGLSDWQSTSLSVSREVIGFITLTCVLWVSVNQSQLSHLVPSYSIHNCHQLTLLDYCGSCHCYFCSKEKRKFGKHCSKVFCSNFPVLISCVFNLSVDSNTNNKIWKYLTLKNVMILQSWRGFTTQRVFPEINVPKFPEELPRDY